MNDRKYDKNYEKKHLLPHPQTRLAVILLAAILIGFLPFLPSKPRSEAEINATVEFLKAGGYEEEYFYAWTVEARSETDVVLMHYELEDLVKVDISYVTSDGLRASTGHSKGDLHRKTPYGFRWNSLAADEIVKELMENHGFTEYSVYPTK